MGDFNGDGKADIVWRHTSRAIEIWLLDGTGKIGETSLGDVAPEGTIVGVGEFNDDGRADIVWRHGLGPVSVWLNETD